MKDSLQARQGRLRRVQAQCPDSIFIEAATFSQESSNICFPVSQESQPKRVPRLTKSDCPACRNEHRAHTRVGFCRLAPKEDEQRQNAQHQREQSDTNRPATVEASHRKRQAHPNSSPKKQHRKQAKKHELVFSYAVFPLYNFVIRVYFCLRVGGVSQITNRSTSCITSFFSFSLSFPIF